MGQTVSLQVSSTTAAAGATVPLALNLNSSLGSAPAALQWDFSSTPGIQTVNTTLGAAGSSAAKALTCAGSRCILAGINTNTIPNGIIAILNVTLSATASGNIAIQLSNTVGTTASAGAISVSNSPGTISIGSAVSVVVSPANVSLSAGQAQQLTATVTGGSGNTGVTWTLTPNVGSISNGLYTAPATVSSQQTVTATATSVADSTKSASAVITLLPPVNVTVTPATVSLSAGQTQQLTATVTGGSGNTGVTWTLTPNVGSISNGLYTAPATISSQQTVTVTATSVADSYQVGLRGHHPAAARQCHSDARYRIPLGRSDSATHRHRHRRFRKYQRHLDSQPECGLHLQRPLHRSRHHQFSADRHRHRHQRRRFHQVGRRRHHPLPPVNVTVTPATVSLSAGKTQQFTATVTGGSGNTSVTWTLSPNVGSISNAGLYTAPATISSQQTVTATATSVADPTKSANATINLLAPPSALIAAYSFNEGTGTTVADASGNGITGTTSKHYLDDLRQVRQCPLCSTARAATWTSEMHPPSR